LDLAASSPRRQGEVAISALTGEGLKDLMARIAGIARDHFAGVGAAVLGTDRQRAAARDAAAALRRILQNPDMAAEIMAEDLRLATAAMARVTGRIEVEEVLGDIFSRLCVGK
jgi:tRNA modification GTPase